MLEGGNHRFVFLEGRVLLQAEGSNGRFQGDDGGFVQGVDGPELIEHIVLFGNLLLEHSDLGDEVSFDLLDGRGGRLGGRESDLELSKLGKLLGVQGPQLGFQVQNSASVLGVQLLEVKQGGRLDFDGCVQAAAVDLEPFFLPGDDVKVGLKSAVVGRKLGDLVLERKKLTFELDHALFGDGERDLLFGDEMVERRDLSVGLFE